MLPGPPSRLIAIRSDPALHFRDALAQNAGEFETLDGGSHYSAGNHGRGIVQSILLISVQKLDWEIAFYGSATLGDLAADSFLGRWFFTNLNGVIHDASGRYHYHAAGVEIPYQDLDHEGRLHIMLINRSATPKAAGDAGRVVLHFQMGVW